MPVMSFPSIANPLSIGAPDAARRERHGQWLMVAGGLLLGTLGVFIEEAHQDPLTAVWFRCAFARCWPSLRCASSCSPIRPVLSTRPTCPPGP